MSTINAWAQEPLQSQYLFTNFEVGTVNFQTGPALKATLNYNTSTEELFFMKGDTAYIMTGLEKIKSIVIQNRTLIPYNNIFYEELATKHAVLYIRYVAIPTPRLDTGIGNEENLAKSAIASIKWVAKDQRPNHFLKKKEEFYLKKNDLYILVKNVNSLEPFFPGQLKEIKQFAKVNGIDLTKKEDLIRLLDAFTKKVL